MITGPTATPHDGSRESFASLIEMLDPTRVPDPEKLRRGDIEDLVIRRFRSSPEVLAALKSTIPPRELHRRGFPLSEKEEAAHSMIAELKRAGRERQDRGQTSAARHAARPVADRPRVEENLGQIAGGFRNFRASPYRTTPSNNSMLSA